MLKITVVSLSGKVPPQKISALFDESGGSIGRAPGNRMILPDPTRMVSRVHAEILHRDGKFFLLDRGSNPARFNGEQMEPGKERLISDGDRIQIGAYLVQASFAEPMSAAPVLPPSLQVPSVYTPQQDRLRDEIADLLPVAPPERSDADLEDLLAPPPSNTPSDGLLGGIQQGNAPAFDALGLPIERAAPGGVDELFGIGAKGAGAAKASPSFDPLGGLGGGLDNLLGSSTPSAEAIGLGAPASGDPLDRLFGAAQANTPKDDPLASLLGEAPPKAAPMPIPDHVPELNTPFTPPKSSSTPPPPPQFALPDDALDAFLPAPGPAKRDDIDSLLTGIVPAVPDTPNAVPPRTSGPSPAVSAAPSDETTLPPVDAPPAPAPSLSQPASDDLAGFLEDASSDSNDLDDAFAGLFEPPTNLVDEEPPAAKDDAPKPGNAAVSAPQAAIPAPPIDPPPHAPPATPTLAPDIEEASPSLAAPPPAAAADAIAVAKATPFQTPPPASRDTPPPSTTPAPQPQAGAPSAPPDALLAALLQGLGYQGPKVETLTPELMHRVGVLLREATQGTVDLLVARSATKREIRAASTMIMQRENNPLKFSPTADAALAHLLQGDIPGFMPAVEAMRDAYSDLRAHQFGVMAGMRNALEGLLKRFTPEQLEQRLSRGSKLAALLPMARRSQLWEAYLALHEEISREAEDDFHKLFGREFLRAYEEQIARFKPNARKPGANG